jgi:PKD repeat protein
MVASGAMQHVTVIVKDTVGGGLTAEDTWVNGAANTPMVWNIKLANGNTGLAGTRVALKANFRSPGVRWNAPAPADYDFSVQSVIDWGDGSEPEAGTIASQNDGKGSKRFVTGEHKYGKPGLYTVKVTVTNAYGRTGWNSLEYAVIVHRKAGALAMAGTFDDPAGAGEASIAANVKYKLKGKFPSGKVLFTLGDKSFVSEKLDWMAISGRKAWVRGQGQLNGVGGYEFLVSVCDDRKNVNDLVRVKVWKANGKMETVIYDSQPDAPLDALAVTEMKTGKVTLPLFKGKSWKYYLMQKK